MSQIKNAAPLSIGLGTDDKSTRVVYPERAPLPQHLPKFYHFAAKGDIIPEPLGVASMKVKYGESTYDPNLGYFNHSTDLAMIIGATGNIQMSQRVVPLDANPRANNVIWIDVLRTDVPNYVRSSQGVIKRDESGEPVVNATTPTIPGIYLKYVSEPIPAGISQVGMLTSKPGTMGSGENISTMYPFLEVVASEQGDAYNHEGFSLFPLYGEEMNSDISDRAKVLPFGMSFVSRADAKSSSVIKKTLNGEQSVVFTFKDKTKNPLTDARFDFNQMFDTSWSNTKNTLLPLAYPDFGQFHLYRSNLDLILGLIMENEKDFISDDLVTWDDDLMASTSDWFDFTSTGDDLLEELDLINFLGCKSSSNVPYFTVMISDETPNLTGTQSEIRLTKSTPVYLAGGSDGSLTDEMFETLVNLEIDKYLDKSSEVMDTAINKETIFYDSGFSLETKKRFPAFISFRRNTAIALTTHVATMGEKSNSLTDSRAIANALKSQIKLAPESEFFGTGVMRGIVILGDGTSIDGGKTRLPLLYEIALKNAKMMGAGNYKWKVKELFDNYPGNLVKSLVDVQPAFIPETLKPALWNDGVIYAQPYDRDEFQIPALQTVYDNDTSVLNSWFTVAAICTINSIADDAHRQFTGSSTLSSAQLKEKVENYVSKRTNGIFADMFTIVPEVFFTEADEQRGYSWSLTTKIYANGMYTVMVHRTEAYRSSDLA